MANQFVDFVKQVVALTRDVQQSKENVKELREDLKVAHQKIDRLMEAFQRHWIAKTSCTLPIVPLVSIVAEIE